MFKKVLIANRGEIARRVARTCKRLGIATVAVYSDADEGAPHALECDERVRVGPAQVKESYLNAAAIVDAAKQTGAEAIHPGYGLLSEKSSFARAVAEAGIVFIGPSPDSLDAFGDKMRARHVALSAGVPPVPGVDEYGERLAEQVFPRNVQQCRRTAVHFANYPRTVGDDVSFG